MNLFVNTAADPTKNLTVSRENNASVDLPSLFFGDQLPLQIVLHDGVGESPSKYTDASLTIAIGNLATSERLFTTQTTCTNAVANLTLDLAGAFLDAAIITQESVTLTFEVQVTTQSHSETLHQSNFEFRNQMLNEETVILELPDAPSNVAVETLPTPAEPSNVVVSSTPVKPSQVEVLVTSPTSVDGYFPLYMTAELANAAGNGTSHSHTFNGITYYMPNGVTFYHGDYTIPDAPSNVTVEIASVPDAPSNVTVETGPAAPSNVSVDLLTPRAPSNVAAILLTPQAPSNVSVAYTPKAPSNVFAASVDADAELFVGLEVVALTPFHLYGGSNANVGQLFVIENISLDPNQAYPIKLVSGSDVSYVAPNTNLGQEGKIRGIHWEVHTDQFGLDEIALRVFGHTDTEYNGYYGLTDTETGYYQINDSGMQTFRTQGSANRYLKIANLDGTTNFDQVFLYQRQFITGGDMANREWHFSDTLGATDGVSFGRNTLGYNTTPVGIDNNIRIFAASEQDVKPDIAFKIEGTYMHGNTDFTSDMAGYWGIVESKTGWYTHTTDRGLYFVEDDKVNEYGSSSSAPKVDLLGSSYFKKVRNLDCTPAHTTDKYILRHLSSSGQAHTFNFSSEIVSWVNATRDQRNIPDYTNANYNSFPTRLLSLSNGHLALENSLPTWGYTNASISAAASDVCEQ